MKLVFIFGIVLIVSFLLYGPLTMKFTSTVPTPTISISPQPIEYTVITITLPPPTITPKPTITPTPTFTINRLSISQINELITKYANHYSVNRDTLWKIGNCESHFNPIATNGMYVGIFQFSPSTWISMRRQMNLPDNINLRLDTEESIKTAAFKLSVGGIGAWPECGK